MNQTIKTVVFWAVIVLSASLLWQTVRSNPAQQRIPEISYSQFMSQAEAGQIARVDITGNQIQGQYREGKGAFRLNGPNDPAVLVERLREKGVEVWFKDSPSSSVPSQLLGNWAPLILLGALWVFMIRQMRVRRPTSEGVKKPETPGQF